MEQNEDVLIQTAQAGDRAAQTELYQRYVRLLYGYLYHKLGSIQDAEDICQETFARAFKALHQFAGTASFKNWLFQIAKHLIADHWTKHFQIKVVSVEEFFDLGIDLARTPAQDTANLDQVVTVDDSRIAEVEARVKELLSKLPADYRQVLEYRFMRGYSIQETADAIGISVANTKIRQLRALKKARSMHL